MKFSYNYAGSVRNGFNKTLKFSKNSFNKFSSHIGEKFTDLKNYSKSEHFEDDIDQLILNLQMFDDDLIVPNMDKINRNQRINKKFKLIRNSFKNLNIDLAPYGMATGAALGPKGAAAGAFLGTYVFIGCLAITTYGKFSSTPDPLHLVAA